MGTCFKFYIPNLYGSYLIAVLICYLYVIIYRRTHNVFRTLCRVSFLTKFATGGLELGKKLGLGCFKNIILSAIMCYSVFNCQGVLYNFF